MMLKSAALLMAAGSLAASPVPAQAASTQSGLSLASSSTGVARASTPMSGAGQLRDRGNGASVVPVVIGGLIVALIVVIALNSGSR